MSEYLNHERTIDQTAGFVSSRDVLVVRASDHFVDSTPSVAGVVASLPKRLNVASNFDRGVLKSISAR